MLESPTWRASPRWAAELGYSDEQLAGLNRKAIALMEELRARYESPDAPVVISGCVGRQPWLERSAACARTPPE